jgi:DNA processing protein
VIPREIRRGDADYPPQLNHIFQPPKQLYVQGDVELLAAKNLLAVVGSRKASAYGAAAVKKLLAPVVQAGIPLVSGLAFGIDSMAHALCVTNNTPTIAVLGSGLDDASLYPRRHRALAQTIVTQGGAVITEYAPGTPPFLGHFPARNRIIAGLARATLVVQAADRSGSLITARLALDSGKDVMAVPGAITDPLSFGTNQLIQQGAIPVLTAQDILDYFGLVSPRQSAAAHHFTAEQELVLSKLSADPQHVDELVEQTRLAPPIISATLVELEMIEVVQNVGGMKYVRILV